MTSKREQIMAQVQTTLAGTTGVGSRIYRSRPDPVRVEDIPCVIIDWLDDSASYNTLPYINRVLRFQISIIQRSNTNPDTAVDNTWVSAYKKLMADRTLNGKVQDLTPLGTNKQLFEANQPTIQITETFQATYRTLDNDPEN